MDYSIFATEHTLLDNKRFNNDMLIQMDSELSFMLTCLESSVINMDDFEAVTETFGDTVRNIIQAIINFFKRLFGDYAATSEKKISEFQAWYKDNKLKLDAIDHTAIDVMIAPYWKGDGSLEKGIALLNDIRNTKMDLFLQQGGMQDLAIANLANEATFIENDTKIKPMVDKNGDLTKGATNYFKFGNADATPEHEKISGQDIKAKVALMVDFCNKYDNDIVKRLLDEGHRTDQTITKIEAQLKITPATATAPAAEGMFLMSDISILRNCINYEKVMEAGRNKIRSNNYTANKADAPAPTTAAQTKPVDNKPADTKKSEPPTVIDKTNKEEVADNAENKRLSQYNHKQLQALNTLLGILKKIITTAMSAYEKKFVDYFAVLKIIADKEIKEPGTTKEEPKAEPNKAAEPNKKKTNTGKKPEVNKAQPEQTNVKPTGKSKIPFSDRITTGIKNMADKVAGRK